VQVSVYVEVEVRAPVLTLPLSGWLPLHVPEAVHEVALLDDQVKLELPPLDTLVGLALTDTVGGLATVGLLAPPLIVTMAEVGEPRVAPEAPEMATAKVLVPEKSVALLTGTTKVFGAVSR
jgi:hypothetical protein